MTCHCVCHNTEGIRARSCEHCWIGGEPSLHSSSHSNDAVDIAEESRVAVWMEGLGFEQQPGDVTRNFYGKVDGRWRVINLEAATFFYRALQQSIPKLAAGDVELREQVDVALDVLTTGSRWSKPKPFATDKKTHYIRGKAKARQIIMQLIATQRAEAFERGRIAEAKTCEEAKRHATKEALLEGSIRVLREVLDNPNRKSYYMELLNEALETKKRLRATKETKE